MSICKHKWERLQDTICCEHYKCELCDAIKKTSICDFHTKISHTYIGKEYFVSSKIGNFKDDIPLNKQYINELEFALNEFNFNRDSKYLRTVIEIGAGIGRLIPMFLKNGFDYTGLEYNEWAVRYMENAYDVKVIKEDFMKLNLDKKYNLVVCIHTLEHFKDADVAFEKLCNLVTPYGYLLIEVPHRKDLYNPDHYWFFDKAVLYNWADLNDFEVIGYLQKKVIEREDYIYCLMKRGK